MQPKRIISISTGDHRARVLATRDALIEEHLGLVHAIAERVKRRVPPSFDLDDLISTGYIALIHAAQAYRPDYPSEKICTRAVMPFSAYARKKIRGAIIESIRRRNWEESTRPPLSPICIAPVSPSDPIVEKRVRLAIADLPPRLQALVALHYFEEVELRDIARRMGLHPSRVAQLKREAVEALTVRLRDVA